MRGSGACGGDPPGRLPSSPQDQGRPGLPTWDSSSDVWGNLWGNLWEPADGDGGCGRILQSVRGPGGLRGWEPVPSRPLSAQAPGRSHIHMVISPRNQEGQRG
ncbi:hypothetical protein H1C71_021392, partial [Ictidomys tridecemlineatus]